MKLYLVMKAIQHFECCGIPIPVKLPDGEYIIPAFTTLDKALEHTADGKYEIRIVETGDPDAA